VEEIEGLAQHDRRSIRLKLTRVLMHLIAQRIGHQQNTSWRGAVLNSLFDIELLLEALPSLREYSDARLQNIYRKAVKDALSGANIKTKPSEIGLPENCLYTLSQLLEGDLDALRGVLA
jgi:hypothetical protein